MLHFLKKYFFLFIILHFNEIVEINSSNDLFKEFKTKNPSCDVSNFIESSNINNHNSQLFLDDLTNFCSNPSIFDEHVRLICSIVFKQLDFICRLDEGIRPSMKNYGELYDLTSLCLLRKVPLINRWIEKTFLVDEKIQMNLTKSTICSKLTSFNETKHLVRFIYKIGSRLKLIDETDRTNLSLRRHRKRQNEPFQIDGDAQHDPGEKKQIHKNRFEICFFFEENSNHGVKGDFNQSKTISMIFQ
jgi:hypothetical protein